MPGVSGQTEEHDLPVRPRDVSDVWRQDERMSHLQEDCGEEDTSLLAARPVISQCDSFQNMYIQRLNI